MRDPIIAGRGRIKIRDNLIFKHRDDPNIDRHGSMETKHNITSDGKLFSTELYSIIREYIIVYIVGISLITKEMEQRRCEWMDVEKKYVTEKIFAKQKKLAIFYFFFCPRTKLTRSLTNDFANYSPKKYYFPFTRPRNTIFRVFLN